MKLYPKARPVRIKLTVGGEEHSSLESLRNCFNVKEVLEHYNNGGLKNWLRQINRLDLLEGLDRIGETTLSEKYKQCILIFFDRIESECTLETILLEWLQNSYTNFTILLNTLMHLPQDQHTISVVTAKKIFAVAEKRNDEIILHLLSKYFFEHLKKELDKLSHLYENAKLSQSSAEYGLSKEDTNDANKAIAEYNSSLSLFGKEWGIKFDNDSNLSLELEKISECVTKTGVMKFHIKEFTDFLDSKETQSKQLREKMEFYIKDAQRFSRMVKGFTQLIHEGSFSIIDHSTNSVKVVFNNTFPYELIFGSKWGSMLELSTAFGQSSSASELYTDLGKLFMRTYLCSAAFKNLIAFESWTRLRLAKLKIELNKISGVNEFSKMSQTLHTYLNIELARPGSEHRRMIILCGLLICILSWDVEGNYSQKDKKKQYLKKLTDQGYRPAQLYAWSVYPSNSLEAEFMKLDDVEKMRFVAEHILDF